MTPEDLRLAALLLEQSSAPVGVPKQSIERLAAGLRAMAAAKPDAVGVKCSVCGEWQQYTPSGMTCKNGHGGAPGVNKRLFTIPKRPQWVGLTEDEANAIYKQAFYEDSLVSLVTRFSSAIEAALRAKNEGAV